MNITIQIPDNSLDRVVNAICEIYSYDLSIEGQANPPTKAQFAKLKIIEFIKSTVKAAENKAQIKTIEAATNAGVEGIAIT